mmetsp:Transcript_86529/g.253289  ORF Transcript_86529/g.253289 Transcript_86529/m.253289 type:complete len:428 (-) Transcript_86529:698-1981(-)
MPGHVDRPAALPPISQAEVECECRRGKKWIIVDNTVLDVKDFTEGHDAGHKGGDVFSIGRDNTHIFKELHANLPQMSSKHRPDLPSVTDHIMEKVRSTAVGILESRKNEVPLTDARHRFWKPSERKMPYTEEVSSSLAATGGDAAAAVAAAVARFEPDSPEYRAFWAIIGLLVADAASQPTHWNYKVTYYHAALKERGCWEAPEFTSPSMNAYYHVPLGSQSCFGDQAATVLRSLVRCGGRVDTTDLVAGHVEKFGEQSEYGKLGRHDGVTGGELPIKGPWRHGTVASFLKKVAAGKPYPECGNPGDGSSDCFVKIVPVVALYAGHPDLLQRVAEVCRVTQNNPFCEAYACTAARILEQMILEGASGEDAVSQAVGSLHSSSRGGRARSLDTGIAMELIKTMELQHFPYLQGVLAYCGGQYNAMHVS